MTISGSGGGGNIGGQSQPSVRELEQTAANETLKLSGGLALTKDTLNLAFYELGGQIGRYPANPSRPTLPPLISTRGPSAFESGDRGNWQETLSALVGMLPAAVRNDYNEQMSLSLDQRNLNFVALDNVLTQTAVALTWLQGASGPSTTEGVAARDIAINTALPLVALEGLIGFADVALSQAADFLDISGANYPQQDSLRNAVRLAGKGVAEMQGLQAQMQSGGLTPTEQFALLSAKLSAISVQYDRIYAGDDLSMLSVTLAAMASLTAALSVSDTASPLLFMALATTAIGIDTQNSATGIIGPALAATTLAASAGLTELLMPKSSPAMQEMLKMIVTTTFLGAVAFGTVINDIGLGIFPKRDPAEVEAARAFSTQLALIVAIHSGVVSSTTSALVETFGLAKVQQQYMQGALQLLALTTIALAIAPHGDPLNAAATCDTLQGPLTKNLTALSALISEGVIDHTLSGEAATSMSISLGQAQIALASGDIDGFIGAMFTPLSLVGLSQEQYMRDIGTAKEFVHGLAQALSSSMHDETNTDTHISIIA